MADFQLANQSRTAFRAELNEILLALLQDSASNTAPTTTSPYMRWLDYSANPWEWKVRNAADDAWLTLGTIDPTTGAFTAAGSASPADGSVVLASLAAALLVTAAEGIANNNNDNTIPTSAAAKAYADAAAADAVSGITSYTDAEARTAQKDHSVGGIGSYAMLSMATVVSPGDIMAGSSLRYSAGNNAANSNTSPPGTWRCMGALVEDNIMSATVWLRIA